jgi:hypothetical protein
MGRGAVVCSLTSLLESFPQNESATGEFDEPLVEPIWTLAARQVDHSPLFKKELSVQLL